MPIAYHFMDTTCICAYLIPILTLCGDISKFWGDGAMELWIVVLKSGGSLCSYTSVAALAMIAGTIIATERADRSAEFLAALPPSRFDILFSKLCIVFALALFSLFIGSGGSAFADWLSDDQARTPLEAPWKVVISINCLLIGIAWCCSAISTSAGASVAVGLLSPLVILALLHTVHHLFGFPETERLPVVALWVSVSLGICSFLSGSIYFIRRIEP